ISQYAQVTSSTVKLTQGTQNINTSAFGANRLGNITTIDFNVSKAFRRGRVTLEPMMNVFNAFNAAAITVATTQLGPSYGNAVQLLGSRLVKFGAKVSF